MRNGRSGVALGIAAAAVLALTSVAGAQPGEGGRGRGGGRGMGGGPGGGFGGGMREMSPAINSRDLDSYADLLGLTPDQREATKALFEGYDGQNRRAREQMQAAMEKIRAEFQETRDPSVWEGMRDQMTSFRGARAKADEQFFGDYQAVLTPAQAEKWPLVERAVRRDTTLRRGLMSGERVNLLEVAGKVKVQGDAKSALDTALADYEVELDRALSARNTAYDEGFQKMAELRAAGDLEAMQKMMDKGREASVKVRDVNRKFARQIAEVLPEDQRDVWNTEFRKASYPEVFRPTLADRSFESALALADLSDEQRERVVALNASYAKSAAATNEKLASAITEREETMTVGAMMGRGRGGGEGGDDPSRTLRREKREQSEKAVEELKKVLGEDLSKKLPVLERDEEEDGPRQRMRRGNEPT